jgi:hypothetical protein
MTKKLRAADEQALIMGATAALSAFGGPIIVKDQGLMITARGARIDAEHDHSLTLIEFPAKPGCAKQIGVFLAPDSDLAEIDGEPRKLRAPLCLFSLCERPAPVYLEVVPHMDAHAWLKPAIAAFKRALAPVVAAVEKRPLN